MPRRNDGACRGPLTGGSADNVSGSVTAPGRRYPTVQVTARFAGSRAMGRERGYATPSPRTQLPARPDRRTDIWTAVAFLLVVVGD
jgi:hypothetical protein